MLRAFLGLFARLLVRAAGPHLHVWYGCLHSVWLTIRPNCCCAGGRAGHTQLSQMRLVAPNLLLLDLCRLRKRRRLRSIQGLDYLNCCLIRLLRRISRGRRREMARLIAASVKCSAAWLYNAGFPWFDTPMQLHPRHQHQHRQHTMPRTRGAKPAGAWSESAPVRMHVLCPFRLLEPTTACACPPPPAVSAPRQVD